MISQTVRSNVRFLEIMRYIRFDLDRKVKKSSARQIFSRFTISESFDRKLPKCIFSSARATTQRMNSFCHVRHVANSSSIWLIYQKILVWSSGWQLMSKNLFYSTGSLCRKKRLAELRRERAFWCWSEANGPDSPPRLSCHKIIKIILS